MLDFVDVLCKLKKRINVLSNIKDELKQASYYNEKKKNSLDGIEVIECYEKMGIINYLPYNDFKKYFSDNDLADSCLFTENKKEAKIIKEYSNNNICFYKISDGKPVEWQFNSDATISNGKEKHITETKNASVRRAAMPPSFVIFITLQTMHPLEYYRLLTFVKIM